MSAFVILKYVFNHSETIRICNIIASEVVRNEVSHVRYEAQEKTFSKRTTLDLYKEIAKNKLKQNSPLKYNDSN